MGNTYISLNLHFASDDVLHHIFKDSFKNNEHVAAFTTLSTDQTATRTTHMGGVRLIFPPPRCRFTGTRPISTRRLICAGNGAAVVANFANHATRGPSAAGFCSQTASNNVHRSRPTQPSQTSPMKHTTRTNTYSKPKK